MYTLYSLLFELTAWIVLVPWTLLQIATRRVPATALRDRLRGAPLPTRMRPRLVIHAVSVGEMNAASALVHELVRDWEIVLTAGNEYALRVAKNVAAHHAEVVAAVRMPWDRATIGAWLQRADAAVVVTIEAEIWPNLIRSSHRLGVPFVIAGARLSPRDARRYASFRWFFGPLLRRTSRILAIDTDAARAFTSAGAPAEVVKVTGSLKPDACLFDHEVSGVPREPLRVIAANTHDGEELLIAQAFEEAAVEGAHLVLAPRHPWRAGAIRRKLSHEVVAKLGGLRTELARAEIAIIGGTFGSVGGHDPFEAARAGCAIVFGPQRAGIATAAQTLLNAGAALTATPADLAATLRELQLNHERREEMQRRATECAMRSRGGARRAADEIRRSRPTATPPMS